MVILLFLICLKIYRIVRVTCVALLCNYLISISRSIFFSIIIHLVMLITISARGAHRQTARPAGFVKVHFVMVKKWPQETRTFRQRFSLAEPPFRPGLVRFGFLLSTQHCRCYFFCQSVDLHPRWFQCSVCSAWPIPKKSWLFSSSFARLSAFGKFFWTRPNLIYLEHVTSEHVTLLPLRTMSTGRLSAIFVFCFALVCDKI